MSERRVSLREKFYFGFCEEKIWSVVVAEIVKKKVFAFYSNAMRHNYDLPHGFNFCGVWCVTMWSNTKFIFCQT